MQIKKSIAGLIAGSGLLFLSTSITLAQEATPSPSPSPSSSPNSSPSSSPSQSPSSSPTTDTSPSPTSEGGTTKEEVLGESTVLGETSAGKEVAKWAIALFLGSAALYFTIKTARGKAEE